jgi:hypothetical protein
MQAAAEIASAPTPPMRTSVILEPVHRKRVPMVRAGLITNTVDRTSWT